MQFDRTRREFITLLSSAAADGCSRRVRRNGLQIDGKGYVINCFGSCPLAVFSRQQHSSPHAIESHSGTGGGPILGSRLGGRRASEPSIATKKSSEISDV
jgi:hypothetical protein